LIAEWFDIATEVPPTFSAEYRKTECGGAHFHERSGRGYAGTAPPLAGKATPENLLANIHEGLEEPLYLDNVHYTAPMNRRIAAATADRPIEPFLPVRSVQC